MVLVAITTLIPARTAVAASGVTIPVISEAQAATLHKVGVIVRAPVRQTPASHPGAQALVALPGAGVSAATSLGVSLVATAMVGGVQMMVDNLSEGYQAEVEEAMKSLDYQATLERALVQRSERPQATALVSIATPWPVDEAAMNALPAQHDLDAILFVDVQWGFAKGMPFPSVVVGSRVVDRHGRTLWRDLLVFHGPIPTGFGVKERHDWLTQDHHYQTILLHAANAMRAWLDDDLWARRSAPPPEETQDELIRVGRHFGGIRWPLHSDACMGDPSQPGVSYLFVRVSDRVIASAKCTPKWTDAVKADGDWKYLARQTIARQPLPSAVHRTASGAAQ
jgi:hypothetical protein